jgi:phosphatidylserine/phosphatidylglycerophosphate/cardiolipin synthase-like enzyme
MQAVYDLIEKAKKSVLFLVFNPGSPSILNRLQEVAEKRKTEGKTPLFVRGAISDAKMAEQVTTSIFSRDVLDAPDKYYVTGVAAIPGPFSYFEKELLKLGFATIHDKILVIDPFEKDAVVVTGSHNLGFKASYCNDENMLIIQNNPSVAQAYAAHVLDVVNHFKWRYKLQQKIKKSGAKTNAQKEKVLKKEWNDLRVEDTWMDYYFGENGFKQADQLFLPSR